MQKVDSIQKDILQKYIPIKILILILTKKDIEVLILIMENQRIYYLFK